MAVLLVPAFKPASGVFSYYLMRNEGRQLSLQTHLGWASVQVTFCRSLNQVGGLWYFTAPLMTSERLKKTSMWFHL